MLRRDFMKALGAFGAAAAVPGAAKAITEKSETSKPKTKLPEPKPEDVLGKYEGLRFDPPAKPGTDRVNVWKPQLRPKPGPKPRGGTSKRADAQDVVVTLERGEKKTVMHLGEGSFTFTEQQDMDFLTDRGVLDSVRVRDQWVDFDLDGVYDWIEGDLIHDTLKHETNELEPMFKMTIDTGTREYICAEGMWTAFSLDTDAAFFDLQGRFCSMEQVHFFET